MFDHHLPMQYLLDELLNNLNNMFVKLVKKNKSD